MSMEVRGGRKYYTRSKRVGGRIRREYVGSGELAEFAAKNDALKREGRRLEELRERSERDRLDEVDEQVDDLCRLADLVAKGALLVAGYHLHRGEWRKRREQESDQGEGRRISEA